MKGLRLYDPDYYCEVTLRTIGGEFGFDLNDTDLRDLIYGVVAEACERYKVAVFAFHFMSNHYHGLYGFSSAEQLVMFFAFLHGNLARLAHRANGTQGKFWAPLKVFAVARDSESVTRRIRYIMGQAVAAGLVDHPGRFPGASSVDAMLYGTQLMGRRLNNTQRCRDTARLVGGAKPKQAYESWIELPLSVPHCWSDMSPKQLHCMYSQIAADLVEDRCRVDEVGRAQGECLSFEINANFWDSQAATSPDSTVESPPEAATAPPPKQKLPARTAEGGGRYRHGPVKSKRVEGKRRRSGPPRLLAADQRLVDAYEERYQASVAVYYQVKAEWRGRSRIQAGALHGAKMRLPPWMLAGTLPLRLTGEAWASRTDELV